MNAQTLLDDADRIAATDLYPARCRKVIADLAAALRKSTSDLDESREYALALEAELKARGEQTSAFVVMASSMHDDGELEYDHPRGSEVLMEGPCHGDTPEPSPEPGPC